jgi:hypothetical protein
MKWFYQWFYHSNLWLWAGAVAKYLFGHVLVALRQGWKRRDAAAEEKRTAG